MALALFDLDETLVAGDSASLWLEYKGAEELAPAGMGAEEVAKLYQNAGDDSNSIMVKALADRLAEACAEWLHKQVRTDFWGYDKDEALDNDALIKEQYKGIRPAPGYPACPDHSLKAAMVEGAVH